MGALSLVIEAGEAALPSAFWTPEALVDDCDDVYDMPESVRMRGRGGPERSADPLLWSCGGGTGRACELCGLDTNTGFRLSEDVEPVRCRWDGKC